MDGTPAFATIPPTRRIGTPAFPTIPPHAPNWCACVGRGFFRAWPRYARSESDDHVVDSPHHHAWPRYAQSKSDDHHVDSPHHPPGPVTRDRNRMTTTSIHRTTRLARYAQSESDDRRV